MSNNPVQWLVSLGKSSRMGGSMQVLTLFAGKPMVFRSTDCVRNSEGNRAFQEFGPTFTCTSLNKSGLDAPLKIWRLMGAHSSKYSGSTSHQENRHIWESRLFRLSSQKTALGLDGYNTPNLKSTPKNKRYAMTATGWQLAKPEATHSLIEHWPYTRTPVFQ